MASCNGISRTLSTPEIGAFVAGRRGRSVPYEPATIRRWIQEEGLPAWQDESGRWFAESKDVLEWLKGRGDLGEGEPEKTPALAALPNPNKARESGAPKSSRAKEGQTEPVRSKGAPAQKGPQASGSAAAVDPKPAEPANSPKGRARKPGVSKNHSLLGIVTWGKRRKRR